MTNEDKSQDQEILRIRDSLKGKVPWTIFVWALGIMVTVFGVGLTISAATAGNASDIANDAKDDVSELKTKVEVIGNDVGWIRSYIENAGKKSSASVVPSAFSTKE